MATYNLTLGDVGAYDKTLVAATVDTVNFARQTEYVELSSDGAALIYFTVDGSVPTVGGARTLRLGSTVAPGPRRVHTTKGGVTQVQLISSGTPVYSVAEVRD